MIVDALAVLLILLPVADWLAAVILVRAARQKPPIHALTERAWSAVLLSIAATFAAILGFVRLQFLPIEREIAITMLALALVFVSIPALYWLWLYEVRGFDD